MARKRKRSKMAGKCKIVRLRGGTKRRLCWSAKGKIKSNTAVRG